MRLRHRWIVACLCGFVVLAVSLWYYSTSVSDNRLQWHLALGSQSVGGPHVVGRFVIIRANGRLRCLNSHSGNELWEQAISDDALGGTPFGDVITVVENHKTVREFAIDSGKLIQEYSLPKEVDSLEKYSGGFVCSAGSSISYVNENSRKEIWSVSPDAPKNHKVDVLQQIKGDGMVYAAFMDFPTNPNFDPNIRVSALDLKTGHIIWRKNLPRSDYGMSVASLVYGRGLLVVQGPDSIIYALDCKTGQEKWKYNSGSRTAAKMVMADSGAILVTEWGGDVINLNYSTGVPTWSKNFADRLPGYPILRGGKAYLGGNPAVIVAFDIETGTIDWTYSTRSLFDFYVTSDIRVSDVSDVSVFAVKSDGNVYALARH